MNTLKKVTNKAKEIRRKHPGMKWKSALKQAGKAVSGTVQKNVVGKVRKRKRKNKWIQRAVNPKHKGYCTPMSKKTCTPKRKALARRFKRGISGVSDVEAKRLYRQALEDKLGDLLLRREKNTKRIPHIKMTKEINHLRRQLNNLK